MRASDGAQFGPFPCGAAPTGVAFDGKHIWVNNFNDGTVTKLTRDGKRVSTTACGAQPTGIGFDGVSMWIVNEGPGTVTKK